MQPPILLFLLMVQWLQIATKVFHADALGIPVGELASRPGAPVARAAGLGLVALLVLASAHWLMLRRTPQPAAGHLAEEREWLSPHRVFVLYLALAGLGQSLQPLGWRYLGLMQVFVLLANLKWVPLFGLAYIGFSDRRGWYWVLLATAVEVVLGFGGYFSSFKTVFFVLFLAALTARLDRFRPVARRRWAGAAAVAVAVFALLLVWQAIKDDYRRHLNRGTGQQAVLVPWSDRLATAYELTRSLDGYHFARALRTGLERLAYIDYFAEALAYVPSVRPHSAGAIWRGAVQHVLTPRAFFPEKAVLPSDSELTMRYTGRRLATGRDGTSISMGYVAESYVDFGVWLMFVPILLMGLLQGWIYRFFLTRTPLRLAGYGFALVALFPGMLFETTVVKYLGGTLSAFVLLAPIARWAMPPVLPGLIRRCPSR
jgi:hypothetical protein